MTMHFSEDDAATPHSVATISCPECGTQPTDESLRDVQLSNLGYAHADTHYECAGCGHTWVHGVPVGDSPDSTLADDLRCEPCDGWYLVHRVETQTTGVKLHLKCPDCYAFTYAHRDGDPQGRSLVGYPQTTGELNPDKPYGWVSDPTGTEDTDP